MMKRHWFNPGVTMLAVLLALVLTAVGCSTLSDNSPTDPGDSGSASTSARDTYAEAFIRADIGGSLRMGDNRVYFPAGALAEDTVVSILREGDSTTFELSPDGIQFLKSVTLTLEMATPGGFGSHQPFSIPVIYCFNEATSQWDNLGGVPDFSKRVISTQIEHFSRYGTGTPWFN
jgi:hypothetical protein